MDALVGGRTVEQHDLLQLDLIMVHLIGTFEAARQKWYLKCRLDDTGGLGQGLDTRETDTGMSEAHRPENHPTRVKA